MNDPRPVEEMLAHEAFLRGLVRGIVHGEAEVDDVLQETWKVAIEKPPRASGSLRAWLARVARNAAFGLRRAQRRRARREAVAARPEGVPSPVEILEREALRRRLVTILLALDPLYRDPIVLRWFEGLSVSEVAARLGVPLGTAKTRLRRGLERLRERLDERHRGDRGAWMAALLPLAGSDPAWRTTLRPPSPARLLAPVAAAVLAAGGALWIATASSRPDPVFPEANAPAVPARGPGLATSDRAPPARDNSSATAPPRTTASGAYAPGVRPAGVLRGVVFLPDGATPCVGASVEAVLGPGASPGLVPAGAPTAPPRRTATDGRGRFAFDGIPSGAYRVRASGHEGTTATALAAARPDAAWVRLVLAPDSDRTPIRVLVRGPAGGPVAGARVEFVPDEDAPTISAATDAAGFASLDPGDAAGVLVATADGAVDWRLVPRPGDAARRPSGETLDFLLSPAGAIHGVVRRPTGEPVEGAVVEAWRRPILWRGPPSRGLAASAATDARGEFRMDGASPGIHVLLVRGGGGVALADPPDEPADGLRWIRVAPGQDVALALTVVAGGVLVGRVVDETGLPVRAARVEVGLPIGAPFGCERTELLGSPLWRLDEPWPDSAAHPYGRRVGATDADGRYRFDGLPASGAWRFVVSAPGREFDSRPAVAVGAGETVTLSHRLGPAGALEALLPPGAAYAVLCEGEETAVAAFVAPNGPAGAVTLAGLAPGRYALVPRSWRGEGAAAAIPFEVAVGKTTLVDAADRAEGVTRLVLERRGTPVEGAALEDGALLRMSNGAGVVERPGGALAGFAPLAAVRGPEADAVRLALSLPAPEWEAAAYEKRLALPEGRLCVRVLDAAKRPVDGALVRVRASHLPVGDDATADVDEPRRTDAGGAATFSGLPAGTFDLVFEGPDGSAAAARTVRVPDEDSVDVVLVRR